MARTLVCTLAELLESRQHVTDDDHAVVAAATHLINSGQVRLCGRLASAKVRLSPSLSPLPKFLWPSLFDLPHASGRAGKAKLNVQLAA